MMWTANLNPTNSGREPIELVILKQKLAKLTSSLCKCISDRPTGQSSIMNSVHISPNNKQVQVEEQRFSSVDRFTQVSPSYIRKDRDELTNSLTKDVLCPSCFVTMNLLRGGTLKILKDEESETKPDMFSCDKGTEKIVNSLEKTTSLTIIPKVIYSDLYRLDDSDSSLNHNVKRYQHQVKFGDVRMNYQQQTALDVPPCFCLEKFVDSIRPPLVDTYPYFQNNSYINTANRDYL